MMDKQALGYSQIGTPDFNVHLCARLFLFIGLVHVRNKNIDSSIKFHCCSTQTLAALINRPLRPEMCWSGKS